MKEGGLPRFILQSLVPRLRQVSIRWSHLSTNTWERGVECLF